MFQPPADFAAIYQSLGFAQTLLLRTCSDPNGLQSTINAVQSVPGLGSIGRNRQAACSANKDRCGHGDCGRTTSQRHEQGPRPSGRHHRWSRTGYDRRCGRGGKRGDRVVFQLVTGAERGEEPCKRLQIIAHSGCTGKQPLDLSVGGISPGHVT
jgi:hypothetical protein